MTIMENTLQLTLWEQSDKTIVYLTGANDEHVFPGEDYIAYLTRGDDGHCNLPCRS